MIEPMCRVSGGFNGSDTVQPRCRAGRRRATTAVGELLAKIERLGAARRDQDLETLVAGQIHRTRA